MLIAAVIKPTKVNMFKSISIPQKCLLLAITCGRDKLRISAERTGRDPGRSSLFAPYAIQQHRETRPKLQILALLCCLRQMVQLQAMMEFVSKHQKGSVTSDTVFELSLLKEKPFKSPMPAYARLF